MKTHSSTLARITPWTEGPGGLQSMGWQRVGHKQVTEHARKGVISVSRLKKTPLISASLTEKQWFGIHPQAKVSLWEFWNPKPNTKWPRRTVAHPCSRKQADGLWQWLWPLHWPLSWLQGTPGNTILSNHPRIRCQRRSRFPAEKFHDFAHWTHWRDWEKQSDFIHVTLLPSQHSLETQEIFWVYSLFYRGSKSKGLSTQLPQLCQMLAKSLISVLPHPEYRTVSSFTKWEEAGRAAASALWPFKEGRSHLLHQEAHLRAAQDIPFTDPPRSPYSALHTFTHINPHTAAGSQCAILITAARVNFASG